ncbi:hypothetical protein EVAR_85301_1 [Eumeta japonica]|uniref:Uncharacterized protein n=1 Tax=Eumeta variegata TaxID=151549 RepID=A0A4C1V6Y4_EUMVA|nr:hypothetical protein EVAR_85301_1 [Eumeta japonica]
MRRKSENRQNQKNTLETPIRTSNGSKDGIWVVNIRHCGCEKAHTEFRAKSEQLLVEESRLVYAVLYFLTQPVMRRKAEFR